MAHSENIFLFPLWVSVHGRKKGEKKLLTAVRIASALSDTLNYKAVCETYNFMN